MPEMPHFNNWNATLQQLECHTSTTGMPHFKTINATLRLSPSVAFQLLKCGIYLHYPTADKRCDLQFSFLPAIRPVSINNNHHETDERKDK